MIKGVELAQKFELEQDPAKDETGNDRQHGCSAVGPFPQNAQGKYHRKWRRYEKENGLNFFKQRCVRGGEVNGEGNAGDQHRHSAPASETDLLRFSYFAL